MTELERLKEQKREIERQIKALICPKYEVDGASLERGSRRGEPLDCWRVRLQEIGGHTTQYKEVVYAETKEEAIEGIYNLIYTLTTLVKSIDGAEEVAKKMRGEK